ncbi:50S ribosomal protein L2 [bacterium]|nr:50S ribosomal protein L2 [bacterium]
MGLKSFRPVTPVLRFRTVADFSEITKDTPEKSLTSSKQRTNGRNSYGRVTVRFRGGGHKRRYRFIDFRRDKVGIPGRVAAIEYDPNRSARIALVHYADGEKRYIIAPIGLTVGQQILAGSDAEVKTGNALQLKDIPVGEMIHNVELQPGGGAKIARGAGTAAQLMAKLDAQYALVRLPSGEQKKILLTCRATIGTVSNPDHANVVWGKAGASRWRGRMPHNRGVSQNPVDHPHGGGEGKTSGGRHPVTPWGQPTKGFKTRNNKRTDSSIVRRRK